MSTVALHNLWSYLQGLSLSPSDRAWLADHLVMPTAKSVEKKDNIRLEEALAKFSGDWGGEADALTIANELREGRTESRIVDTW